MKILWLTRENPLHGGRGDLMYSGGLVRSLAGAGDQVTILSYHSELGAPPEVENVRSIEVAPSSIHRMMSLFTGLPADGFRLKSAALSKGLRQELESGGYDAVAVDYFAMGWTVREIEEFRAKPVGKSLRLIYVSHHYEQEVRPYVANNYRGNPGLKLILHYDAWKSTLLERRILASADLLSVITPDDAEKFAKLKPGLPCVILSPGYDGPVNADTEITAETDRVVLLVGAFDWIAKRQNLREFVRAAREPFKQANITLRVVGRAAPDFIEEIKDISPEVVFVGPVPEVFPYMRDARIGLMPDTLGGGFKLKYLDYIFNGLPIATIRSQARGLPLDLDRDLIADNELTTLVSKIVAAVDDLPRLNAMRTESFSAAKDAFRWETRGLALRAALEAVIRDAPRSSHG